LRIKLLAAETPAWHRTFLRCFKTPQATLNTPTTVKVSPISINPTFKLVPITQELQNPRWLLGGFVLAERKNEAIFEAIRRAVSRGAGPGSKKDETNPISGYEIENTGTDRRCDRIEGRISSRPYGFARTPAFAEARSKNEKQSHFSTLAIGLLANAKPADLGYPRPAAT